jgi:hypothetical protein
MTQNTIQKSISIVFCVSTICHDLSLGKYRKQKQSPPGTEQRYTEGRFRVTAATSQPVRAEETFPLDVCHFEYYQGCECLPKVHQPGPWRQHFDDELRSRQNHWEIIGKTKKLGFCMTHPEPWL